MAAVKLLAKQPLSNLRHDRLHKYHRRPCLSRQNIRTHATVFLPTPLKRVSSVLISCAHRCVKGLARKPWAYVSQASAGCQLSVIAAFTPLRQCELETEASR